MKKVGILSMQRIANYGSFLQAYGLKCILEELDCDVQFVDYHPGETLVSNEMGNGFKRNFLKAMEVFSNGAPYLEKLKYIKYKRNYVKNYYPYLGIDKVLNYSPELDVLVIGSDEVFNCVQDNTNVGYSLELFGYGNRAKKVISYAASFGNTTIHKLNKYKVKNEIKKLLMKFDSISVRDNNSVEIIKELVNIEPEYHLDPVLVYDFVNKCEEIPNNVKEENYMILYGYSGRFSKDECKFIREYANKKGLKIFCIGGVQECCDKFIDCNPFEVIAYFQHAECVITDTFHGSILSIITHRQFGVVVRSEGYGNSEKLTDLLNRINLRERVINDFEQISILLENTIDYINVEKIIQDERLKSYEYLMRQIGVS